MSFVRLGRSRAPQAARLTGDEARFFRGTRSITDFVAPAAMEVKREELYKAQIDVQERIRKAAALGDLSENAEYHFAKEENRAIQRQLAELESKLRHVAVVSNEGVPDDMVFLLSIRLAQS